jgi:iron complex transport system ATP-binding protein
MTEPLLAVRDLSVAYGRRTVVVDVAFTVVKGEFVAVIGPNGAGKTSLMKAIAGLIPAGGDIAIGGTALSALSLGERARRVAYLPQGHVFHWPLAVVDIVALGRLSRGAGADLSEADMAAVDVAMAATGTSEYAERRVTTLSGGERARVAVARVLASEAPLILADEPTASLDPRYQIVVTDILKRHATAGGAVVAVLHDLGLAARAADRLIVLDEGRIVADGPPRSVLTAERLADSFGVSAEIVDIHGTPAVVPWKLTEPPPAS